MAAIGAIGNGGSKQVSKNKLGTSAQFIAMNNNKKFHMDNIGNYLAGNMIPPKSC